MSVDFGVSRNTLREAFRLLVRERLLVYKLHRGVFVRSMTLEDAVDLYQARRVLELSAVRGASVHDISGLQQVLSWADAGSKAALTPKWADVGTANTRFHEAIIALARSERLKEFGHTVFAELRLVFGTAHDPKTIHGPYVQWNREIADLLVNGRFHEAETELRKYLDDAELQTLRFLRASVRE